VGARVTQGGARASLALGYYQVIPTGFHFGSLRSHIVFTKARLGRVSTGAVWTNPTPWVAFFSRILLLNLASLAYAKEFFF
jgi:hypothetical protein